jgi:two-component system, cell cycle sensor histidine kinase and response regulator CckA
VVHGIVCQAGGHISVDSEVGIGTVVKLNFSVASGRRGETLEAGSGSKTPTILLAEDNETLRELIGQVLVSRGYAVLEAANGLEALEHAKRQRAKVDAIVTDIVMPVMGGLELARKLEQVCPEVPVVYMSGHSEDTDLINERTRNGAAFLQKPFPITELVRILDQRILKTTATNGTHSK